LKDLSQIINFIRSRKREQSTIAGTLPQGLLTRVFAYRKS
jgi:hypothetical protein